MPRTKKVKSTANRISVAEKAERQAHNVQLRTFNKNFQAELKRRFTCLQDECTQLKMQITFMFQERKVKLMSTAHRTIEEMEIIGVSSTQFVSITDASTLNSILTSTSVRKGQRPVRTTSRRNKSGGEDEGYLTAGSRASSETRQSRTVKKLITAKKAKRVSRSLSNSKQQKTGDSKGSATTPQNKPPSATFGYITPKVKPNTPQVILRRPELGEMAFSVQGSPLMTYDVTTKNPNVNIPLSNGKIVSIQPQHGLRRSQVPDMDQDTLDQVKVLFDNLSKVIKVFEQ